MLVVPPCHQHPTSAVGLQPIDTSVRPAATRLGVQAVFVAAWWAALAASAAWINAAAAWYAAAGVRVNIRPSSGTSRVTYGCSKSVDSPPQPSGSLSM